MWITVNKERGGEVNFETMRWRRCVGVLENNEFFIKRDDNAQWYYHSYVHIEQWVADEETDSALIESCYQKWLTEQVEQELLT